MVTKARSNGTTLTMRVSFSLPASTWADTIYLVGDFNNWDKRATPLQLDGSNWYVELDLALDRAYQYRYLVDNDTWTSDWNADSHVAGRDGVDSSVVYTGVMYR